MLKVQYVVPTLLSISIEGPTNVKGSVCWHLHYYQYLQKVLVVDKSHQMLIS